jgi:Tol biopolymer transport system component
MISSNITNSDGVQGLAWTPDGKIVYPSNASGNYNLWTMSADGSNTKQITEGKWSDFAPSVSPDGRTVVFHSIRTGGMNIWRIDADGGNPRQLSSGDVDFVPLISPDGKWVVYGSERSGRPGLQKVAIEGGKPIPLNDVPSDYPAISPDGKYIAYYFNDGGVKIGIIPFNGGKPIKILDIPLAGGVRFQWSPDGSALDYVDVQKGVANIWRQPIAGGPSRKVTDFTQDLIWWFAYSHDGKQLALARGAQPSDVVMISNLEM